MVAVNDPVETWVPLVTVPRLWSMTPVPPLNTPVSVVLPLTPATVAVTVCVSPATGALLTSVTVAVAVTPTPTEFVAVSV